MDSKASRPDSQCWSADDERAILDSIEQWVEKEVRPIARKFDQADEYPHELVEQMKELGLFGATIGQQYGGLGLPASTYAKIVIKVASAWMAPSGIFNSDHGFGDRAFRHRGAKSQFSAADGQR